MKLLLPEPLGPIRTLRFLIGKLSRFFMDLNPLIDSLLIDLSPINFTPYRHDSTDALHDKTSNTKATNQRIRAFQEI
jgi:hypothetical protein